MPDQFDAHFMKETGVGMAIHSPSRDITCPGCGKKYAKDSDFLRHWRVPIPCQIPNCLKTFRDDKRRAYLNHHASEHRNDEQNELSQAKLESYFYGKRNDLRHSIVPYLCVNKLGCSPESNAACFENMQSSATVASTKPRSGSLSHHTVDADGYTPLLSLFAPETSIGSSPLALSMNGLLNAPDVFPSSLQLAQLGTGFDYGREKLQPPRPDECGLYLEEQISVWKKALSTQRHHSECLHRLLAGNKKYEKRLEDKIKEAEEELDKILHAKEPEFQASCDHQDIWSAFMVDAPLEGQNEV